jgi:DNA-binding IclR family transcriptional regulator
MERHRTGTGGGAPPRASRVQSVDRAALLLQAVAAADGADATAPSLAKQCGLNRATAWRILSTLETHGLVGCDRTTGRWSVGEALMDLAKRASNDMLVQKARAALEQLSESSGETSALAIPGPEGLTYVEEVAPQAVVAATWQGRTVPLHATSTGKALLAYLPEDEARRLVPGSLRRYTATTVTDQDELWAELADARANGYSVCRGEYDTAAWGVSAPVLDGLDRPRAILSIWGPAGRLTEDRFAALGSLAASAAAALRAAAS